MLMLILPAIIAMLFALLLWVQLQRKPMGTEKMIYIKEKIRSGALVFLHKEYNVLVFFALAVAAILTILISRNMAIAFLFGAVLSAAAGNIGMRTATSANVRAANACRKNTMDGMRIAFSSGTIMGMMVTGLGLLGIIIIYMISKDLSVLFGFGFGASSIALFARVGGGIFTKAADIGADVVGKIEKGMAEDDPRNPAVIADNVGDNVGDVAGMGADLFESYVDAIIAAMVIGIALNMAALPLVVAGFGIFASIIGYFCVRGKDPEKAMNRGLVMSTMLMIAFTLAFTPLAIALAIISGLIAGIVIGFSTEFYTSSRFSP
ncbi:MAG: sodium/proton-translocating pyrophosphatase, partial [Candidatus Aenigmarchaeota archaeon]|nr:sodium/proton-translocating pyrophosphatase [Candidatus Aenigmarchaeota archaeon]